MNYHEELKAIQSRYPHGEEADFTGWTLLEGSGEWSALYDADGQLVLYGDHDVVGEWMTARLGMTSLYVDDPSDWLFEMVDSYNRKRELPLPLLEQVRRQIDDRQGREAEARALEEKAIRLQEEAKKLRARR